MFPNVKLKAGAAKFVVNTYSSYLITTVSIMIFAASVFNKQGQPADCPTEILMGIFEEFCWKLLFLDRISSKISSADKY